MPNPITEQVEQNIFNSKDNEQYVVRPKYKNLWSLYEKHQSTFWVSNEIDLSKDYDQWITLNKDEQHFIKHVLAFFAAADGIVNENLLERFMQETTAVECQAFYVFQAAMEHVHAKTYANLLDVYVPEREENERLFNAIVTMPVVAAKAQWAQRWIADVKSSFRMRLVAFLLVEGVFFSGSFCAIYWMKKRGKLPGLAKANDFISRDEGIHCDFAVAMLNMLAPLPEATVHQIFREAVEIEKDFITAAIPCRLIGMNSEEMQQYIEYVADRLLVQLNYSKIWNSQNPFDFMIMISIESKSNFFENRASEYSKAGATTTVTNSGDNQFGTDEIC